MEILQAGLKQAKTDLEAARTQREKLTQTKRYKDEEIEKLTQEIELLQTGLKAKEDSLFR